MRGAAGGNIDDLNTMTSNQTTLNIFGLVRLAPSGSSVTSAADVKSSSLTAEPVSGSTATDGFGFTGCSGESQGACTAAPAVNASSSADERGAVDVFPGSCSTGLRLGVLLANQVQGNPSKLPLATASSNRKLPTLDKPGARRSPTSGTLW